MAAFEIPLSSQAQRFTVQLAGTSYVLTVRWCTPASSWILDIATALGAPLVCGIPLITGSDLLGQYQHLGIAGQLFVQSDDSTYQVPTFDSLGKNGHLYFVPATT